ncbi:hypothetical protein CVO96_18745 [Deinococcus koreensis]|uniref:Uncharacterized protein n=2 Tax=Deinococcus koreensis TaxID=2054903 RepID=A0A2K3USG1_9DEIO|nr:hypothetical protein CVO96_18745 [Deinococcus koreensis]
MGRGLLHLGWALLAALLTVLALTTLLVLAWIVSDPQAALAEAGYAWLGLLAFSLMFAVPVALAFTLLVVPLAGALRRLHSALWWLALILGGAGLCALMSTPRFAALGALGAVVYGALAARARRRRAAPLAPGD